MIDPTKVFQINGQVYKLDGTSFNFGVGNNQAAIAAVTGKIIRVMGLTAQSNAAAGSVFYKDSNAGTTKVQVSPAPTAASGLFYTLPVINSGYFESLLSAGIYVDIFGAAVVSDLFYIIYTP